MPFNFRIIAATALLAVSPTFALAASPWDGNWQIKPGSYKTSGKPDKYLLIDGQYTCGICNPGYTIKADGNDQPITGNAYADTVAVKIVDAHTVDQVSKQKGKVLVKMRRTVSADGKSMVTEATNYMGAKEAHFSNTSVRTAASAPGSHAISGEWQASTANDISDAGRTMGIESTAKGMKLSWNGTVADAEFGGPAVMQTNDPGHVMVALKKLDARTIEETDTIKGEVSDVVRYQLSADGKTITVVDEDKLHEQRSDYVMEKLH